MTTACRACHGKRDGLNTVPLNCGVLRASLYVRMIRRLGHMTASGPLSRESVYMRSTEGTFALAIRAHSNHIRNEHNSVLGAGA